MRILCGGCDKNPASVMCCADEVALCTECDARAHAANKHANKRARVALRPAPEPTKCDICQEKQGFFFCLEDRALLCRDCDVSIHTANTLSGNHKRFLVPGTRVALEDLKDEPVEPITPGFCSLLASPAASSVSQSSHCSSGSSLRSPTSTLQGPRNLSKQASSVKPAGGVYSASQMHTFTLELVPPAYAGNGKAQIVEDVSRPSQQFRSPAAPLLVAPLSTGVPSAGCMRRSSVSEFLTDAVPGWRVDELLNLADCSEQFNTTDFSSSKVEGVTAVGGNYDWTADLSLFEEQMFSMHEVPEFPPPPPTLVAPPRLIRAPRQLARSSRSRQDAYLQDAFVVPDVGTPSAPASSASLPKRFKRDHHHMSN